MVFVREPTDAELPTEFGVPAGCLAAVVGTIAAVAIGATHRPMLALLPLGAATLVVAVGTGFVAALATAWMCVLFDAGFVTGREGRLAFPPETGWSALTLVLLAVVGVVAGRWWRAHPAGRRPSISSATWQPARPHRRARTPRNPRHSHTTRHSGPS